MQTCEKCGKALGDTVVNGECPTCLYLLAFDCAATTGANHAPDPKTIDRLNQQLPEYEILELLGVGGMGAVYKARQLRLNRIVAIKILPTESWLNRKFAQRFLREAEVLANLQHPAIVSAHDAGEVDGMLYLVMEYVEGVDLATSVRESGPVDVEHAVAWTIQAAKGLQYAHRQGVIHRDVKPSNLIVSGEDRARILDLGLARSHDDRADSLTEHGQVMGTVDFMSPEQAADARTADQRSDVYSLGCTLHYLLTGRPLYQAESFVGKIDAHRHVPVPSLRDAVPSVSRDLDVVFQRMVAKRPEDRLESMLQVIAELNAATNSLTADSQIDIGSKGIASTAVRLVLLAVVVLCGLAVYRIQTDNGTLVVKLDETAREQIEARLKNGGVVVVDKRNGTRWTIKPNESRKTPGGSYEIQPTEGLLLTVANEAGVEFDTHEFKIRRNDQLVVLVKAAPTPSAEPAADVAGNADPPKPPKVPTGPAASREAAGILLRAGCRIAVQAASRGEIECRVIDDLPDEPFTVSAIFEGPRMSRPDLIRLADLLAPSEELLIGGVVDIDSTLQIVSKAKALKSLVIHAKPGQAGFRHVNATGLHHLAVGATNLTDADFNRFTRVVDLCVTDSDRLSGDFLKQMPELEAVQLINVASTTNATLAHFVGLEELQQVSLDRCRQVDDAGINQLHGLKGLKGINLNGTSVTAEGVERLRRALPDCNVGWRGNGR